MPHIIVTHLSNFMTIVMCNTIRRKATETLKVGDASDAYITHLQNFSRQMDDMKFYNEYINAFMGYCSQESYHALFDVMQKDIAAAFCGSEVAAQFGMSRLPIVVKGIFTKTFRESASRLMKTPGILDMVANGSQGGKEPCARLIKMAIDDVMTEYMSGDIEGDGKKDMRRKVNPATYEALKEKYTRLTYVYNDVQHKLDKTVERYEDAVAKLKDAMQMIQGYKTRLREVEGNLSSFKTLEKPVSDRESVVSESSKRGSSRESTRDLSTAEKTVISDLSKKAASRDKTYEDISIIPESITPFDSVSNAPPSPSSPTSPKKKKSSKSTVSKKKKKKEENDEEPDDAFNSFIFSE